MFDEVAKQVGRAEGAGLGDDADTIPRAAADARRRNAGGDLPIHDQMVRSENATGRAQCFAAADDERLRSW